MQISLTFNASSEIDTIGKSNQKGGRWQGKTDPGGQRSGHTSAQQADGKTNLTAGGTWQKLAKRHQL